MAFGSVQQMDSYTHSPGTHQVKVRFCQDPRSRAEVKVKLVFPYRDSSTDGNGPCDIQAAQEGHGSFKQRKKTTDHSARQRYLQDLWTSGSPVASLGSQSPIARLPRNGT